MTDFELNINIRDISGFYLNQIYRDIARMVTDNPECSPFTTEQPSMDQADSGATNAARNPYRDTVHLKG